MAIALTLETREQAYKIYGGSAGFTKIIQATGLVDTELTPARILEVLSDLERRKAIVGVLLDEGEFEPEVDFSSDRKKEALILKLAKQLDTSWIINLIASLANEMNLASTNLSAAVPAIATQSEPVQTEMPLEAIAPSNIAEGE